LKTKSKPPKYRTRPRDVIDPELMRIGTLARFLDCSVATTRRKSREPGFPEPIKLSQKFVAWKRSDIEQWITKLPTRNQFNAAKGAA
jgi:predicted DNA-binding transcriptional regulator AlpA